MSERASALPRRSLLFVLTVGVFLAISAGVAGVVGAQQSEQMVASWYGPGFEGATTASGETFDPYGYTAAHKTLPFGTTMIVTYQGSFVVVRINDRGPYVAGRDLDLSQGAAEAIGLTAAGSGTVDVTYTDPSTPLGPYSGSTAPASEQPQTRAPQQKPDTAPSNAVVEQPSVEESVTDVQYGDGNADDAQYNNSQPVANDQPAAEDQYANVNAEAGQSAADVQYSNEQSAADAQYTLPPVPESAPGVPASPVVEPTVPDTSQLEAPPVELATPGSTVERRIELAVAAPPENYAGPLPQDVSVAETPVAEEPVAGASAAVAPVVAEAPVAEKPASGGRISKVYETGDESPSEAVGITVLPDTGGLPVLPLAGGAALALVSLVSLVAVGLRVMRR